MFFFGGVRHFPPSLSQEYGGRMLSLENNQKLGLCHALLELGDWAGAYDLIKLLPPFLPVWSTPIVKVLCELISCSIEPLYRRSVLSSKNCSCSILCACCSYSPRAAKGSSLSIPSFIKPCASLVDLYPSIFNMLYCLGPHLHSDPILLAKVIRLGRTMMKERTSSKNTETQEKVRLCGVWN